MIQCSLFACIRNYNQEPGNDRQAKKKYVRKKVKAYLSRKS